MTRSLKSSAPGGSGGVGKPTRADHWILQSAKTHLSEVVRRARSEGPQHVTVHGRPSVVVVAEEEFRRLKGEVTGVALIDALRASPFRETEIEPSRGRMPVRDVDLP
jgi:prevent-host-death family protein